MEYPWPIDNYVLYSTKNGVVCYTLGWGIGGGFKIAKF